jgi:hypothetical protein
MRISTRITTIACLALAWYSPLAAKAADDEVTRTLSLVSLEYRLAGKDVPRIHQLADHAAMATSADSLVREIAQKSVAFELAVLAPEMKEDEFYRNVEKFVGVNADGSPNVEAVFDRATDKDWFRTGLADVFAAQKATYQLQNAVGEIQDRLWDRAAALAQREAGADPIDPKALEVTFGEKKGLGATITLRNKGAADLHRVTVAAIATKKPLPPDGSDLFGDNAFSRAVKEQRKLQMRPARVFAHVSTLPAGTTWEIVFLRESLDLARCESSKLSIWSDEMSSVDKPIPRLDYLARQKQNSLNGPQKPPRRR